MTEKLPPMMAPDDLVDDEDDDIFSSTIDVSVQLLRFRNSPKKGRCLFGEDQRNIARANGVCNSAVVFQDLSSLRNEELFLSTATPATVPPPLLTNISLNNEPTMVESEVPLNDDKEVNFRQTFSLIALNFI